jgi:hypothetical protein
MAEDKDRNTEMVRKVKGQKKGPWVKRRLKTGKWFDRDEAGNLRRHSPGALVEVPEHLARANPEQFALEEGGSMAPPSQAIASAAPIPGPSEPAEPEDDQDSTEPTEVAVPSTPLTAGETIPIPPHEKTEPVKGEKKGSTLPVGAGTVRGPGSSKP